MKRPAIVLGAVVVIAAFGAALVVRDLAAGHERMRQVSARVEASRGGRLNRPVLRSPEVDCDARQKEDEVLTRVAAEVRSGDVSPFLREVDDEDASKRIEAAVSDVDVEAWLATGQCRETSRADPMSQIPTRFLYQMLLFHLAERRARNGDPETCLRIATQAMRVAQDDDPAIADVSAVVQKDVARRMGLLIVDCAKKAPHEAVERARRELEEVDRAYLPLSVSVVDRTLVIAAGLSSYYDRGSWPFPGLRAHVQLHRAIGAVDAILRDPGAWRAVDVATWPEMRNAWQVEVSRRKLPSIPFGDNLVSESWWTEVSLLNHFEDGFDGRIGGPYLAVRTLVRIVLATLAAPDGQAPSTDEFRDPFTSDAELRWSGADYFSVGPNGLSDGGQADDIALRRRPVPATAQHDAP